MTQPAAVVADAPATFASSAPFYDALTAHHNYEALTDTLEALIERHGRPGRRLLDLACGTGKSSLPFARRGYRVTACDISQEMLAQAREKPDVRVRWRHADMRALPELGGFDLVTCIDEPISYLLDPEEVAACFRSVARTLRRGGLFLFDLTALRTHNTVFARVECYEQQGWFFVWRGHGDGRAAPGTLSAFTVEAFAPLPGGGWRRHTSHHQQRHHPRTLVSGLLHDAGLETIAVYGLTPDGGVHPEPDEARHTKFLYFARKSG